MGKATLQVFLTASAGEDLDEIAIYWSERGEPERGEKYAEDLHNAATAKLADSDTALRGKVFVGDGPEAIREFSVFKRAYRIFYTVDERARRVEVLRFWHSHRDEPEL